MGAGGSNHRIEVFKLAGEIGVEPWSFTYRELDWMAEGRRAERWDHTAALISHIRTAGGGGDKSAKDPSKFHPYEQRGRSMTFKQWCRENRKHDS